MYYFECCNKYEGREDSEKHIFSSVQGHKTIGSRAFEFENKFVEFIEMFFTVSFHSSLPDTGTAKPPALVPTNRKALEQTHFSKRVLSFTAEPGSLDDTLHNYFNGSYTSTAYTVMAAPPMILAKNVPFMYSFCSVCD